MALLHGILAATVLGSVSDPVSKIYQSLGNATLMRYIRFQRYTVLCEDMPSTSDAVFLSSCTTISWLGNVIDILSLIGPAGEWIMQTRGFGRKSRSWHPHTSIHDLASSCALRGEQHIDWRGVHAEHHPVPHQYGMSSHDYINYVFRSFGITTQVTLYQVVPVNLPTPSNCTEAIMESTPLYIG